MKSVVMIAYCFPPEGNAGTYRPLRFARHLPSHGWRPIVIADDPKNYERYDPGLLELLPPSTTIFRVRNPDPWKAFQERRVGQFQRRIASTDPATALQVYAAQERPLRSLLREAVRKVEANFYRPDGAMLWVGAATKAAVAACAQSGAVVVWATGGPWSSLVVARNVSRRTGLPYVLDLRDSWTLSYDELQVRQSEWAKARDRKLLRALFSGAQAVVLRYMAEAESYWRAYPGVLDPKRIHLIPNGYDGSIAPFNVPRGERCVVLYTGGVGPYIYESLLEALALLKQAEPESARQLRIVFVGEQTELIHRIAIRLGLSDIIETSGPVPSSDVNRLQSQAHALLLLGWKPSPGCEFGGSKIFGYLKAGRPIVGVLPQDENTRILRSVGISTIADAGSLTEIIQVFRRLLEAWSGDELSSLLPNRDACATYSAERQTRALVRALEGSPALDPFIPGASGPATSLRKLLEEWAGARSSRSSRAQSKDDMEGRALENEPSKD